MNFGKANVKVSVLSLSVRFNFDDIASTKQHSKSFKQIYMDWMYEKYLRNEEI
jgi:hypothetical protein